MTPSRVRARREGRLGRITLDRPEAINALTPAMVEGIDDALQAWEDDTAREDDHAVDVVVLDGAGERGLCAGGDLTIVRDAALGDPRSCHAFLRAEYALDARVARSRRPVVALMDGVVMGGGIGLSARAALRVVTERSRLAMPEVSIGLAPDVGGPDLLAAAPGELGTHVALTAAHLSAADALRCGLADVCVASADLDALLDALQHDDPATVAARFARSPGPAPLDGDRAWIDSCYAGDDLPTIVDRLAAHPEPRARAAGAAIATHAPTAVTVTLRALREAAAAPGVERCLVRDFRTLRRFLAHPDLVEGIGARLVERRTPRWSPARLADVDGDFVRSCFAPLGDEDLVLPGWPGGDDPPAVAPPGTLAARSPGASRPEPPTA